MSKRARWPLRNFLFHSWFGAAFSFCGLALVSDGKIFGIEAVAAFGAAMVSFAAAISTAMAGASSPMKIRFSMSTYFGVFFLAVALMLLAFSMKDQNQGLALVSVCVSAWLFLMGSGFVHWMTLTERGFVDLFGQQTRFEKLSWFRLAKTDGDPPRVILQAGHDDSVHIWARLAASEAEAEKLSAVLTRCGIRNG